MKKTLFRLLSHAALLSLLVVPCRANMVVNGSFEDPSVGGSFALVPNGSVPGWTGTNSQDGMEIDTTSLLSPAHTPAYDGTQSTEVDDTFESISQTITGLTAGAQYTLSWAYGLRPASGAQALDVYFGGNLVAHNGGVADPNVLIWTFNSITVTAMSTSETLVFQYVSTQLSGTGNEIDAVSLDPVSVPEPNSIALFGIAGFILVGLCRKQGRRAASI